VDLDEHQIEAAALNLDSRSRAKLAEKLLKSLDALGESEIEAIWADEAERRSADLDSGAESVVPADEVFRDARSRLR
jgi:putative addiction module component (TIGR02574 family)